MSIFSLDILQSVDFAAVLVFVEQYQYFIALITPLIIGEISIHILGVLNGSGTITPIPFFISIFSIVFFETLIYFIARVCRSRYAFFDRARSFRFVRWGARVFGQYERQFRGHSYFLLFAMKLMPFTKLAVFLFALRYRMSIFQFMFRNAVVTSLWAIIVFVPGWLVGREFLTQEAGRNLIDFLLYFFLVVVLLVLFGGHIERGLAFLARKVLLFFERRRSHASDDS